MNAVSAAVDTVDTCLYIITVNTRHVCSGSANNGASAFSMGYVAIILFFVVVCVGLCGYYLFLGIKTKNWGIESMGPPLNLCKYFWIFSFVGCKVSMEWIGGKTCRKGRGHGDLGDDLVETDDS